MTPRPSSFAQTFFHNLLSPRTVAIALVATGAALTGVACLGGGGDDAQADPSPLVDPSNPEGTPGAPSGPAGNPNGADIGGGCKGAGECKSGICTNGACQPGTPRDGVKNGDESDVDCGGTIAPKCTVDKACGKGEDCTSGVCTAGKCAAPTATDGVKNGDESDVDCGGKDSPKCAPGKACLDAVSCESNICTDKKCTTPAADDAVKNGTETDVDCGGGAPTNAPKCAVGKGCAAGGDCTSGVCKQDKCVSPAANDGVKNGTETDVDCGGPGAGVPRCATAKACNAGSDCASLVCNAQKKCNAPSPTDGVKNGTETDVDCGGAGNPKCATNKVCNADSDCASDGCTYAKKCAPRRSCTRKYGGDTCGIGESNQAGRQHESCCTEIAFQRNGQTVRMDKYDITAGRMRAFAERFNGNLRQAMTGNGNFPQQWLANLPTNMDQLNARMGPSEVFEEAPRVQGSRMVDGCYIAGQGTRTWWAPAGAGDPTKMGRDQLDEKALNCVNLQMMYALCAWDGGRLPTSAEYQAAWRGNDNRKYPWGAAYDIPRMVHKFNYFFPEVNGAGQSCNANGACDNSVFIAAPGRRPTGYGPYGHADLAGLLFNMVWDGDYVGKWIWTGSWEDHVPTEYGQIYDLRARPRYWAAGGRCVR
ncbi:MAG: SUMF1/EgtB/PvdO family nonheme iron enzyme [Polyangiaceae bacterium]